MPSAKTVGDAVKEMTKEPSRNDARGRVIPPHYLPYVNDHGHFDPSKLPKEDLVDRRGGKNHNTPPRLYLKPLWRQFWFNFDHPAGDAVRIRTTTLHHDNSYALVRADVIDTNQPEYLTKADGDLVLVPDENGVPRPVPNAAFIIASDCKIWPKGGVPHLESAITGAIGRVLARIGYGTENANDVELDNVIVDTPIDMGRTAQTTTHNEPTQPPADAALTEAWRKCLAFMRDELHYDKEQRLKVTGDALDALFPNKKKDELTPQNVAKLQAWIAAQHAVNNGKNEPTDAIPDESTLAESDLSDLQNIQ